MSLSKLLLIVTAFTSVKPDEFCDEFILDDLRKLEVAVKACKDCLQVYNLAADMGGMVSVVFSI